jgi:LmbE family N-acetylglucosaminyl deacetylase
VSAPLLPFAGKRVLLVAAHPDDETLFAASQLGVCGTLCIVHTTDGATSRRAARTHGFFRRAAYAKARRRELAASLAAGSVTAACVPLGYRDRTASYRMGAIAARLHDILVAMRPDLILTHGYEGGHLDHDATCCAVHLALHRLGQNIPVWEFAGYHTQDGSVGKNRFPDDGHKAPVTVLLNETQRQTKARMLNCFATQLRLVESFPLYAEQFRRAPIYDFAAPPFAGLLGYEIDPQAPEGRAWRALARAEFSGAGDRAWRRARLWLAFKKSRMKRKFAGSPRNTDAPADHRPRDVGLRGWMRSQG